MEHKITALTLQKRNRQRVNVFLDGEFAFGISRIIAAWLQIDQVISDEKIAELRAADGREVAYQQALKFLSYRQRSIKELRRYLQDSRYPEEIVSETLTRLQNGGLLNDRLFAETWVENRDEFRPRSKRALSIELHQRGIADEDIDQATQNIDDEELAYQAALKHSRKIEGLEWLEFRQKLSSFLARRGFSYDVIRTVVERVWTEKGPPEPADMD
ncbi:MAG: RecX family transcriptional regulator [Omnitrophica WOR_2 bacterium]